MPQYRVTVTELFHPADPKDLTATETKAYPPPAPPREMFSQIFDEFDVQSFARAINKPRRVRKARGKEQQ